MKKQSKAKELLQKLATLMALVLLFAYFSVAEPDKFLQVSNLMNVLKPVSYTHLDVYKRQRQT